MITISIDFKNKDKFNSIIRYIDSLEHFEAQAEVLDLAEDTVQFMKDTINSNRKRPDKGTHKLEEALDTKVLNTTAGIEVGIGEIAKLKQEAPYYEVLDIGGYIPNHGNFVPLGQFVPGDPRPNQSSAGAGNWEVGGKYTFKPKTPIIGINWIGLSQKRLEQKIDEALQKLGYKVLSGIEKA